MSTLSIFRVNTLNKYDWLCDSTFAEWIVNHIAPYGNSILDVGCGNGFMIPYYMEKFEKTSVIEPTEQLYRSLINQFQTSKIIIKKAGAENIPFACNSFDIVIAKSSLHHFSDLQRGIEEIKRVSSKIAAIIEVVTPDERCLPFIKELLIQKEKDRKECTVYTQESFQTFIKKYMDKSEVFPLLYDQYIDIFKWLQYSDLIKSEKNMLYHKIESANDYIKKSMHIHYRKNRLVMLRRMCMCLVIL